MAKIRILREIVDRFNDIKGRVAFFFQDKIANNKKIFRYLLVLTILFFLIAIAIPKNKNAASSLEIKKLIEEMAHLATIEYTMNKIVHSDMSNLFGNKKILLNIQIRIKAGINLEKIKNNCISINYAKKEIHIKLPAPEIIYSKVLPEETDEVDHSTGLLRDEFTLNERQSLIQLGLNDTLKNINKTGIIERTKITTKVLIEKWLSNLNFKSIIVNYQTD